MKKLIFLIIPLFCFACSPGMMNKQSVTGLGSNPFSPNGNFKYSDANSINNAVNDNHYAILALQAFDASLSPIETDGNSQIAALSSDTPVAADLFVFEKGVAGGLVKITWADLLTSIGPSGGWETTIENLQYSTTPTVVAKTLYSCVTNWDGQSQLTITDFLGPSTPGDRIGIFYNANEAKTNFYNNANIKGNSGVDFEGSDTEVVLIIYTLDDSGVWVSDLQGGWINPTTLGMSSVAAAVVPITSAGEITLTALQMNSVLVMTAAGDANILAGMCDTATGVWLTVETTGNFLNSITSLEATDQFVLPDGSLTTAGNELDPSDGSAPCQITVVCTQAHKWKVTGVMNGTPVDGGAAD